jgi:transaldolase
MKANPLLDLQAFGQSIWMDFVSRGLITSGALSRLIEEDGLTGVTSNPSIFEKAIAESTDYDGSIKDLASEGKNPEEIFRVLSIQDIQSVADLLHPVYQRTGGRDGFVSLEVSPRLAHNTAATITEARQLWRLVDRPNVMIKVPATAEGLPAIEQLIGEGININITLLFGLPRYRAVTEAYINGLEKLQASGKSLDRVASVASFFLSRIDVLIDPLLEQMVTSSGLQANLATHLQGKVAIASAKVAYQMYREIFTSPRFLALTENGARTQRVLWASTSTKNPAYPDTMYVEPLIGPETINTLPLETLDAYRDHGKPSLSLERELGEADQIINTLPSIGINLGQITQQLETEGVAKFSKAYDQLLVKLKEKMERDG